MALYQNITPTQLGQAAMTTSYAALYTVPASTRTYLKQLDICNTTASPVLVYVSLVPSGGSPTTSNSLFYAATLQGYTTLSWSGTQILDTASTIQVKASVVGVTITASGGEAT